MCLCLCIINIVNGNVTWCNVWRMVIMWSANVYITGVFKVIVSGSFYSVITDTCNESDHQDR